MIVFVVTRRRPSPRVAIECEPIESSSADPTSSPFRGDAVGVLCDILSEDAVSDGVYVGREGVVAKVGECKCDESGPGAEVDGSLGDAVGSGSGEEVVEVDAEDLSSEPDGAA